LTPPHYVCTFNVKITFDPVKRLVTLQERGLDFATDAEKVFASDDTVTFADDRFNYGEVRWLTIGWMNGRTVVMVWTDRAPNRHIISMRYCHAKEAEKLRRKFDQT
jgi:uncharacterized DUF497 family protein